MYDLVTIGDIKLDVFLALDKCNHKCTLKGKKLMFDFGEKISVSVQDQQIAGSAPNVAIALTRMDKRTAVVSQMGNDLTHELALKFLHGQGVATRFIKMHRGTQSAYSAVLNLKGEKTILASYIDKTYHLPKKLETKWLYLSEMGQGYEALYNEIIKRIHKERTLIGFNPGNQQIDELKPILYRLIKKTSVLFVNVGEAKRLIKNRRVGITTLAEQLFRLGPKEVVITDGRNGSYGFDGTNLYHCPIFPVPRVEATGAGDSFAAAYIGARMHGEAMCEGLRWGTVNSAEVVQHVGPTTGLLRHTQIKSRLRKHPKFQLKTISS